jgi:hypothetical protein
MYSQAAGMVSVVISDIVEVDVVASQPGSAE